MVSVTVTVMGDVIRVTGWIIVCEAYHTLTLELIGVMVRVRAGITIPGRVLARRQRWG